MSKPTEESQQPVVPEKSYRVLSTLFHNKAIYQPESTVSLTDAAAEPLLRLRVVAEAK